jgi:hypothetical protein
MRWNGIPIDDLAHATPTARRRLLAMLADECAEAAARARAIRQARAMHSEPEPPAVIAERRAIIGLDLEEPRRIRDRDRRRKQRAAARQQSAFAA